MCKWVKRRCILNLLTWNKNRERRHHHGKEYQRGGRAVKGDIRGIEKIVRQRVQEDIQTYGGRSRDIFREEQIREDQEGGRHRGQWNGHGKRKKFRLMNGTRCRRPRVRGAERDLRARCCLFTWSVKEVGQFLPELYLHGLAQGDFELSASGVIGRMGGVVVLVDPAAEGQVVVRIRRVEGSRSFRA